MPVIHSSTRTLKGGHQARSPFSLLALLIVCFCATTLSAERWRLASPTEYPGMCDASAAVAVNSNLFVAASDEDNVLRLYSRDHPGPAVKEFDFNNLLEVGGKSLETDIKGEARIGNRHF
jgi:hypothetical protein